MGYADGIVMRIESRLKQIVLESGGSQFML